MILFNVENRFTFWFHIPSGPSVVTKDEIRDPHNLNLECEVNGVVKQNSNTIQMVFKIWDILSWVTKFITLQPGDIFLTGSPSGSGKYEKPVPQFLKVKNIQFRMIIIQ